MAASPVSASMNRQFIEDSERPAKRARPEEEDFLEKAIKGVKPVVNEFTFPRISDKTNDGPYVKTGKRKLVNETGEEFADKLNSGKFHSKYQISQEFLTEATEDLADGMFDKYKKVVVTRRMRCELLKKELAREERFLKRSELCLREALFNNEI